MQEIMYHIIILTRSLIVLCQLSFVVIVNSRSQPRIKNIASLITLAVGEFSRGFRVVNMPRLIPDTHSWIVTFTMNCHIPKVNTVRDIAMAL